MFSDSFSWLHLTDFHYGMKGQDCLWPNLREPFLESLAVLHEKCGPWQAVLFTGDLVQSGESDQYKKMQDEVLAPLWRRLDELGSKNVALLAVPGNHDLYRPKPDSPTFDDPAMETLLQPEGFNRIEAKFWTNSSGAYRRAIREVFAAYNEWWSRAPGRPPNVKDGALPGDFSVSIEHGKRKIGIVGLNTAFLQLGIDDYAGRLTWNAQQLHAVCDGGIDLWIRQHDVCLLLTHHGPNWLTPQAREHGAAEIAPPGRFAAQFFGHQHETSIEYIRRGGGRAAIRLCQGCSAFGLDRFGDPPTTKRTHGYAAGRIDFGRGMATLRLWPRVATRGTGPWRFIPDHEHAVLDPDEGTEAEEVAASSRAPRAPPAPTISGADSFIPHSTLPARRPFFGRKAGLEKIAKYLLPDDRSWGVVLDGPGGVGKTSLAIEAAHGAPAEHFPLKLWITAKSRELHPEGESRLTDHRVDDYYGLLNELGLSLGREDIPRAPPEERPALIRHALTQHKALLVVDNLESFHTEDRRRLFELMGNLPTTCRAIVTSRRRTDGSLAAHMIRLHKLEREAADELLMELGHRWAPVARLTQPERDQLYAETGGNPLLLTWVTGQLGRTVGRSRTVAEALNRLKEAHRLQSLDLKNDPLDFVFGDLADTFMSDEIAVIAALVHFSQPAHIGWLLPLTELSSAATETALDSLRDRALLVEDDIAGTWLLPPLAVTYLRRTRPEAVAASGSRLADWACAYATTNGYLKFDRFPALDAAWSQVAAALSLIMAGDNRRLQRFCNSIIPFLDLYGKWDEIVLLCTKAEANASEGRDFPQAVYNTFRAGAIFFRRGQAGELKACSDRIAGYIEQNALGAGQRMWAARLRAQWLELTNDNTGALEACREMVAFGQAAMPRSRALATCLGAAADMFARHGHFEEAEGLIHEALAIGRERDDSETISTMVGLLAETALAREQWPEAERLAREALDLSERIRNQVNIARQSRAVAEALARQGRGTEGHQYAERAVTIYAKLRHRLLAEGEATLVACRN